MCKRIIAGLTALLLLCLCFGCGQKADDRTTASTAAGTKENVIATNAVDADGKIAVIVGNADQEPELYPAARQLSDAYGDSLMILGYSASYYLSGTGLNESALAAAGDPLVKVLIFAGGVYGTANAAKQARAARDDLYIIVCNPLEGAEAFADCADLVLTVDFDALAEGMVAYAKEQGAKAFVFYTTSRTLKQGAMRALRTEVETLCEKEKITCKAVSCIDILESQKPLDYAQRYIGEDTLRRFEEFGAETALFATEREIQGTLAQDAAKHGMTVPAVFPPSPIALASSLGVDLTGHETDSAYALAQVKKTAAEEGWADCARTWSFSAPIVFLQAAVDHACAVINGSAQTATQDGVQAYIASHTDADFTVSAEGSVFKIDSTPVLPK